MRDIELNPVHAGMVGHPGDYRRSSHRANAQGEASALPTPHSVDLALDSDDAARQIAYRALFRNELDPGLVDQIRAVTNGHFALGNSGFSEEIARALRRRVTPGKAGRPRKAPRPESSELFG